MDKLSTKKKNTITIKQTNAIASYVMSTASINYHSKKVRYFISDHITIDNYYLLLLY